jgi:hypothetical protein
MSDPNPQTPPSDFAVAYPEKLREGEHTLLALRRSKARLPAPSAGTVGFGLSGGGIRSATFALGLFQSMARKKGLLRQIDFISTVSGGGYFGSFFGRLLSRDYVDTADTVDEVLAEEKESRIIGFLRENGRYMSPNGAGDSLLFGAVVLRNWVSVQLVLALFVLALFLGLQVLRSGLELILDKYNLILPPVAGPHDLIWLSPLVLLPVVTFVFAAFPLGWAYWLVEPESEALKEGAGEAGQEVSAIPPVAGLALVFVASLWFSLAALLRDHTSMAAFWSVPAAVALLTFLVWKVAPWKLPGKRSMDDAAPREKGMDDEEYRKWKMDQALYRNRALRNRLGLWLTTALGTTALLFALALVDSLGQTLYAVLKGESSVPAWLTTLLSSLGGLAVLGRWGALLLSKRSKEDRPSPPLKLLAGAAALVLVLFLLVSLDLASHAIAWRARVPQNAPAVLLQKVEKARVYDVEVGAGSAPAGMSLRIRDGKSDTKETPKAGERDPLLTLVAFAAALLLSILFGQTWPFVNRSTHQPIYGARLTRAYLGASNKKRLDGTNITETVEGDDVDLASYWPPPERNAAPIHLINVTINETIDGQSQIQQQDRKGTGLALGPCGLSAGVKHHAVLPLGQGPSPSGQSPGMMNPTCKPIQEIYPESGHRVFDYRTKNAEGQPLFTGEMLPLGSWVAISGAAFSTGIGARTSLGLSLLTGFGNVRLGRWWDSGVPRKYEEEGLTDMVKSRRKITLRIEDACARLFPVQTYLFDELLARFPGTSRRHWYLSDGGHFENMGGYELLRRRLPFIVIVDGEQDTDYIFEGLANMVRKARIDFGAEIFFQTEKDLDELLDPSVRPYFGSLQQLRRGTWEDGTLKEASLTGHSLAHAALARVKYTFSQKGEPATSWLLYVKPTLTGREPVDLLEYHRSHPAFPHESTLDQYFDEAQWESYRRLGQYIGDVLFGQIEQLLPDKDPAARANLLQRLEAESGLEGVPAPRRKVAPADVESYS